MNSHNQNSVCKDFSLWYYDFLFKNKRENIPDIALKHINSCQYCQDEIKKLESLLSDSKEEINNTQQEIDNTINKIISLHLALNDIPVTCEIAKPFIPRLTDPLLQIKIPTPVNAHLDNCKECSKDFNIIRDLALNHEQLGHLGEILAEIPGEKSNICSEAQAAIHMIVSMDFQGISTDILKHVSVCPDCRKTMLQHYQTKYEELINARETYKQSECGKISTSELFYLCLPYNKKPNIYESQKSHILNCPVCLKKIQQLLTSINQIAERPNSNVITKFSLGKTNEPLEENKESIYSGRSINIQVLNINTYKSESTAKEKSNILTYKIKKLTKSFAAAAVILLGFGLFFYSSSVKGMDLSQIYKALENIKNAHIIRSVSNDPSPIQEQWISRTFNIIILKTQDKYVLWDINKNIIMTNDSSSASITTNPLPQDMYNRAKLSLAKVLGILPFQDISQVPKNAKWSQFKNEEAGNTSIYELTWNQSDKHFEKCRFFIDDSTSLIQKTEYYLKFKPQDEYELRSIEEVEYVNDTKIEEVLSVFHTNSN